MAEPCELDAAEARRLIGAKKLSPVELLESCLARIAATKAVLNAVVALDEESARIQARDAERAVMAGDGLGLLHGLPVAVKDLEATAGLRTTWGSLLYKDHVPQRDDPMVASIRDAGANIFCKTNTPEFGAGANTTNRVYGATGNPFDPAKTCGGSSGGSAVALACGMVPLATGSDYGGSLRTPAGFCGVVGFRPSAGLVPDSQKQVAMSPLAVLGPMARTVRDAHLLFRAQLDIDRRDPYSGADAIAFQDNLECADLSTVRAAISADLGCAPLDDGIRETFVARMSALSGVFAEADERHPQFGRVHECFEIIRGVAFIAAHGERVKNSRDLLGPNVIDNTERGLKYTAAEIAWAHVEQSNLLRRFHDFFEDVDVLICPAASVSPFPHEQLTVTHINSAPMDTYMRWLAITYALTMALAVSCTIPCGLDHRGMPFGIQIVGPRGSDELVLSVALALEQELSMHDLTRRPLPDLAALRVKENGVERR